MTFEIRHGDALAVLRMLPEASVQTCVTSPPYLGLRAYGTEPQQWSDGWVGELGLEPTPEMYVEHIVAVFREVKRVLKDDGTLFLNLGDSYSNNSVCGSALPAKNLIGIPWRCAFALQADGWILRSDIVWAKTAPMPESVRDRPTRSHEFLFLLAKRTKYYYDADAIAEPGRYLGPNGKQLSPHGQGFTRRTKEQEAARRDKQRGHSRRHSGFNERWDAMSKEEQMGVMRNKRDVWTLGPQPFPGAHFAAMPEALAEPCVLAGSRPGDLVCDPFSGTGTTGVVSLRHGRRFLGIELSATYVEMARLRIAGPLFSKEVDVPSEAVPAAEPDESVRQAVATKDSQNAL